MQKLSVKCVQVRITETLMRNIKHWYCNLDGIRHMLHDVDMLFLLIYNSSTSNRGGCRLRRPRGQLTVSLAKLIPHFNCLFTLRDFCGKPKQT